LEKVHAENVEAIGWMCADTAAWTVAMSRFPIVVGETDLDRNATAKMLSLTRKGKISMAGGNFHEAAETPARPSGCGEWVRPER